jgi:hypothetical protein
VGTAVLLFEAGTGTRVIGGLINLVSGNADIGIYVKADEAVVSHNRVYDWGADSAGLTPDRDTGIFNPGNLDGGASNVFHFNKVRCYQQAYDNVAGSSNVTLACTDPTSTGARHSGVPGGSSAVRQASPSLP